MKKLGHLGVFILLVFLSVYLPELGIVHLTKFLEWGIDGYSVISLVWELVLVVLFVFWLKKKEMLYIFKKSSKKSRFFYLVFGLVATYFVRQLVAAFQIQYHYLVDNKYIFQDLLSPVQVLSGGYLISSYLWSQSLGIIPSRSYQFDYL